MPNVTIISGGLTGNSIVSQGITFYQWSYTVNVDGQVGVYEEWVDTNDPADEAWVQGEVINDVQENGLGGGIADGSDGSDGSDGVVAADGADGSTDGDGADGADGDGDGGNGNGNGGYESA